MMSWEAFEFVHHREKGCKVRKSGSKLHKLYYSASTPDDTPQSFEMSYVSSSGRHRRSEYRRERSPSPRPRDNDYGQLVEPPYNHEVESTTSSRRTIDTAETGKPYHVGQTHSSATPPSRTTNIKVAKLNVENVYMACKRHTPQQDHSDRHSVIDNLKADKANCEQEIARLRTEVAAAQQGRHEAEQRYQAHNLPQPPAPPSYACQHQDSAPRAHGCRDKKMRKAYNKLLDEHEFLKQEFADLQKRFILLQADLEQPHVNEGRRHSERRVNWDRRI
ncbi:hypothetical protein GE09DRAFT_74684 [Coniochaeta sp. 2T2.1]|nr:hypothetical protein GE09DRAFT_74684 [Coniochaeta sp. 2T2.1]